MTVPNQESLQRKINNMKGTVFNVTADFDFTLTQRLSADLKSMESSFGVIELSRFISEKCREEARERYGEYLKLENNFDMPAEERHALMKANHDEGMLELAKEGLSREDIKNAIIEAGDFFQLRSGFDDLVDFLRKEKIPLIVNSAGVYDVIEETLKLAIDDLEELRETGLIDIHANRLIYDSNGRTFTYDPEDGCHVFSKDVSYKYHMEKRGIVEDSVILIGDHLGDSKIANLINYKEVIKIGLFHYNDEVLKKRYLEAFDVVLEGDGSLDYLIDLVKEVLA